MAIDRIASDDFQTTAVDRADHIHLDLCEGAGSRRQREARDVVSTNREIGQLGSDGFYADDRSSQPKCEIDLVDQVHQSASAPRRIGAVGASIVATWPPSVEPLADRCANDVNRPVLARPNPVMQLPQMRMGTKLAADLHNKIVPPDKRKQRVDTLAAVRNRLLDEKRFARTRRG